MTGVSCAPPLRAAPSAPPTSGGLANSRALPRAAPPPTAAAPAAPPPPSRAQYTRNQRIQQLSPFELDIMGPFFRNVGEKIKHKVEDNVWDVAPPFIFFGGLISFVLWKRHDILMHHRD